MNFVGTALAVTVHSSCIGPQNPDKCADTKAGTDGNDCCADVNDSADFQCSGEDFEPVDLGSACFDTTLNNYLNCFECKKVDDDDWIGVVVWVSMGTLLCCCCVIFAVIAGCVACGDGGSCSL